MTPQLGATLAIILAAMFWLSRSVTWTGALTGAILAFLYSSAPTPGPFFAFAAFVFIGTLSSRLGREKKNALGIYQNEKGPRGWTHALANCGLGAALIGIGQICPTLLDPERASMLCYGSLAAVCADTCASEWGTWLGGGPRSIVTFKTLPIGADGGVTWAGTIAGLLGAAVIGSIANATESTGYHIIGQLVLAGFVGNAMDSVLGATVEPHLGIHGGSYVNALASITGALVVLLIL